MMNAQNLVKYQTAERNTAILKRLEKDISSLQVDITTIKEDIRFIKEYIIAKKKREDARWIF